MQRQDYIPNLVISERGNHVRPYAPKAEHCICDFLQWLDTLIEEDTHQVNVLSQN